MIVTDWTWLQLIEFYYCRKKLVVATWIGLMTLLTAHFYSALVRANWILLVLIKLWTLQIGFHWRALNLSIAKMICSIANLIWFLLIEFDYCQLNLTIIDWIWFSLIELDYRCWRLMIVDSILLFSFLEFD